MTIEKRIPPKHIKLIEDQLADFNRSIIYKEISQEDWIKKGNPFVIQLAEQYDNAYCYLDSGYGFIILIVEDKIAGDKIARGKKMCSIGNVIALDRDYFGTESYIFKGYPNNK